MKTFRLIVASVSEVLFDGQVRSATLPATAGEMTVLANHEPFVTVLKKGTIVVREDAGEDRSFGIEHGVLEISGNRTTVLL
jgi:F-type H+-transporting ATPase subunit epsilon